MTPIPVSVDKPWTTTVPFAQGVKADGEFVFTSGITARDRDGRLVGAGDMRAQIGQCFDNVVDVLRAAGCDVQHVVKWTMYTTDIVEFGRHMDLVRRHFVGRPASTLVEVRRLVMAEMLVEIEAVALVPPQIGA